MSIIPKCRTVHRIGSIDFRHISALLISHVIWINIHWPCCATKCAQHRKRQRNSENLRVFTSGSQSVGVLTSNKLYTVTASRTWKFKKKSVLHVETEKRHPEARSSSSSKELTSLTNKTNQSGASGWTERTRFLRAITAVGCDISTDFNRRCWTESSSSCHFF